MQIEAVATKEELEHLAMLCRSEADAMGRITAGILRLLKLDKSLGQGTIEQLRNLGMELPSSNLDDTAVHSLGFRFLSPFQLIFVPQHCCIYVVYSSHQKKK